jgi:hypothetical protein
VRTVASAKQGLQCLKRIRFDVVVIGGHLRGIGLTEWLSETRRLYPDLPVIVNQVKWPVGREYVMGSPGGFHCFVRSRLRKWPCGRGSNRSFGAERHSFSTNTRK